MRRALAVALAALAALALSTVLTRVPRLPVLTPRNRREHREWHAYVARVYGAPVQEAVDLNEFEWFYNDSPLGRRSWCSWWPILYDQCWVGVLPGMPETQLAAHGFFVARRPAARAPAALVEVLRTVRAADGAFTTAEVAVSWFFVLRGSGVFVALSAPPAALDDRPLWWASDSERAVVRYLGADEAVLFERSRSGWWGLPVRHPRAVLVVATPRERAPTCCPTASLRLRTGWRGATACRPDARRALLNCARYASATAA